MVKVKLHGDAVVEGEVFAVDPVTSSLIIREYLKTHILLHVIFIYILYLIR